MRKQQARLRKVQQEDAYFMRAWRAWHREQLAHALDGPHGSLVEGLMKQLRRLDDPRALLAFVMARNWTAVDYETRLTCMHEVGQAIVRHRVRAGLPPFDDLTPVPNVFQRVRAIIFSSSSDGESLPKPFRQNTEAMEQ